MRNGKLLIDFHVHLARCETLSQSAREWLESFYPSPEAYQAFCDTYAEPGRFCEMLASEGVDYAVLLAENTPQVTGVVSNETVAEFCRGRRELIPFCTLDPLHCQDLDGALRRLADQGFRGVKLYPTYNFFYPNDPMMYPLYAAAQELGLPVMFHTGTSVFKNSRLKYGNPVYYDDIAVDFPNLSIVMSHGGRTCWYDEAVAIVRMHKNTYIDVAGLPPKKLLQYFPEMARLPDRFIFGTDWPSVEMGRNADALAALPIAPEITEKILGGNARRLLKL